MGKVLVNESSLQDIADAIREKTEGTETFLPSAMGPAIRAIETGGGLTQAASGTLASVSTGEHSFTVSGLAFRPKVVYFVLKTSSWSHSGFGSEIKTYFYSNGTGSLGFTPRDGGFTINGNYVRRAGAPIDWVALG